VCSIRNSEKTWAISIMYHYRGTWWLHIYISLLDPPAKQIIINYNLYVIKSDNHSRNIYFYRLPHIWNALPNINYILLRPVTIKYKLQNYFYDHFERNFVSSNACTYFFYAHAVVVANHPMYQIMITCYFNTLLTT